MNCRRCNATNSDVRRRLIPYPSLHDGLTDRFDEEEYMGPYCDKCWSAINIEAQVAMVLFVALVFVVVGIISYII